MLGKIKNYQNHQYLDSLRDVRVLGQVMFLVIVLLVSWSGVKVIQLNYGLQQKISRMQQEIAVASLVNDNLKLKNTYYDTPQYLELAARQNFGLATPGEKELIVPKEVALAYVKDVPEIVQPTVDSSVDNRPVYRKNIQAWIDFILNRQKTT